MKKKKINLSSNRFCHSNWYTNNKQLLGCTRIRKSSSSSFSLSVTPSIESRTLQYRPYPTTSFGIRHFCRDYGKIKQKPSVY